MKTTEEDEDSKYNCKNGFQNIENIHKLKAFIIDSSLDGKNFTSYRSVSYLIRDNF